MARRRKTKIDWQGKKLATAVQKAGQGGLTDWGSEAVDLMRLYVAYDTGALHDSLEATKPKANQAGQSILIGSSDPSVDYALDQEIGSQTQPAKRFTPYIRPTVDSIGFTVGRYIRKRLKARKK